MTAALAVLLALLALGCREAAAPPHLVLATTTSVGNSGLLDVLAPRWQAATGVELQPTLVGSGRALRLLADGQADVVISHAPQTEAAMLATHRDWDYRKFMFNDFVLVGPPSDPAGVAGETTLEGALKRLLRPATPFVSRGDQSGTHEREQALWTIAGATPASLMTSGAGMAVTLRQASDRAAYTLSDRATFEQLRPRVDLRIVFSGDPRLLNTYAVVTDRRSSRRHEANRFAGWLAAGEGRALIAGYRIAGSTVRPFTVWPAGAPDTTPSALPR